MPEVSSRTCASPANTSPSAPDASPRVFQLYGAGLCVLLCGLAAWGGGFGLVTVGGRDLYAMYLPKFTAIGQAYLEGRFPLWNAYEYAGLPLHGTAQGSALYAPVVLANLVLPPLSALQLLYYLHISAFAALAVAYLRRCGTSPLAAMLGAGIAVAGFFQSATVAVVQPHYLFEATFLPAILLAWEALLGGSARAAIVLALLLCFQWLPGYPEFPMDTGILLGIVALASRGSTWWRRGLAASGLVVLGALLAAAQLVPLAETTQHSARLGWMGDFGAIRDVYAANTRTIGHRTIGLYGVGGTVLVVVGLVTAVRRRRDWLAAYAFAFFALTWPLSYLYSFPPYSFLRFGWGWMHLAPFFAGCLAALALDRLRAAEPAGSALRAWFPTAVALALAGGAAALGQPWAATAAVVCALTPALRARGGWLAPAALGAWQIGHIMLGLAESRPYPVPDLEAQQPRIESLRLLQHTLPNQPRLVSAPEAQAGSFLTYGLASPIGHEAAVPPDRIVRLTRYLLIDYVGCYMTYAVASDRQIWRQLAANPGVAAALGVGLVALPRSEAPLLMQAGYREVASLPSLPKANEPQSVLYREPAPRLSVVHHVEHTRGGDESFARVTRSDFDPLEVAIVEGAPAIEVAPLSQGARDKIALVRSDRPEHLLVNASLAAAGVLVLRDTHYPGWHVRVDGTPGEILRVNYAFRGVALEAGEHEIEWIYAPASVSLGFALSGLGLLILAGLAWAAGRANPSWWAPPGG